MRAEQRDSEVSVDDASSRYPKFDDASEYPLQLRGSYLRRVVPVEEVRLDNHRRGARGLVWCLPLAMTLLHHTQWPIWTVVDTTAAHISLLTGTELHGLGSLDDMERGRDIGRQGLELPGRRVHFWQRSGSHFDR